MTGRPLKTVNGICQAYKTEGRIGDAPHRRRPRATTEEEDQLIIAAVADDPFQTANEIMENTGVNAHPATVRNRLKEAGLHSRVAAQKPFLNSTHKTKRLQFAEHASWTSEEWKRVIFTDESTFSTKQAQRKSLAARKLEVMLAFVFYFPLSSLNRIILNVGGGRGEKLHAINGFLINDVDCSSKLKSSAANARMSDGGDRTPPYLLCFRLTDFNDEPCCAGLKTALSVTSQTFAPPRFYRL
ncbi:hypothetical protein V5799_015659 [Amblyomma americanum]|uniref:Transposase Tc1-like domain-containing protein n=1 Tax=Amblyomma americanum TaxID=6943 RepID=A0AAQ4F782_AMBAM